MIIASLALALLPQAEPAEETVFIFEDAELTLDLSALEELATWPVEEGGQSRGLWTGLVGEELLVDVWIRIYSNDDMGFEVPEDLIRMRERIERSEREGEVTNRTGTSKEAWAFDVTRVIAGPYGYVPYAIFGEEADYDLEEKGKQAYMCLAGVGQDKSYFFGAMARQDLNEEQLQIVRQLLEKGVSYAGEQYEKEWKEEEVEERWKKDAPEAIADDLEYHRTKHFLILTNSSGKKKFARELEKAYHAIREVYPFDERPELRLLPIMLFRTPEQYYEYCVKAIGWTREQAEDSKGVAFGDVYATWYEAPQDPVHIHELTHQLFRNRLFLGGGGSWFQEGVAEYMSTKPNDRKALKRLVKNGKHASFKEFFTRRSLLGSSGEERTDGTSPSHEAYLQAACITEFVRESKGTKKKFLEYIHRVGGVPRGDLKAIDAALKDLFEVDVDGFEELFVAYWKKR